MPDPSIDFSPFAPGFQYTPSSSMVDGMERRNTLHEALHPDLPALRVELGIPLDREVHTFEQWGPLGNEKWKGYFFDLIGTYESADDPPEAPRFWLHSPPDGDREGYTARDENTYDLDTKPLIAWRRRVIYQHGPLWIEAHWHPERGEALALRGLEQEQWLSASQAYRGITRHLTKLALLGVVGANQTSQGITLLKAIEAVRGRPVGSTVIPEALFRQRYPEVYQECADAYTKPPRRHEIAEALGISTDTFDRYLTGYGLPFPPF